jgi:HK97 family phage major capsid protein
MAEIIDNSLEKISENIGFLTKKIQDVDTELSKSMTESEKKQNDSLNILEEKLDEELKKFEDAKIKLDKQEAEIKSQDEIIKSLEAMIKRPGNMLSNEQENEYKMAMDKYIRYGDLLDEEMITKGVNEIYGTNFMDEKTKNRVFKSIMDECGKEKGFIFDTKTVRTNVEVDGGLLVRPEIDPVFRTRPFETSPIRQVAEVRNITSNSLEIVIDDDENSSASWTGEEQSSTESQTAKLGKITVVAQELKTDIKVTSRALDDIVNIQSWIQNKTNDKLFRTENSAFVKGDGSIKPKGFLSYDAWANQGVYERHKLEERKSGINGGISADSLIDLQSDLYELYQPNAIWVMKRKTWAEIIKSKSGSGDYLLNINGFKDGFQPTLLGKPVVFMDDMDTVATDARAIAYGDFRRGYIIVDRTGIRVLRDPYTANPYIKFITSKRVGGEVQDFSAIKIYKLSA